MKITISKSQWQEMGKKANWIKIANEEVLYHVTSTDKVKNIIKKGILPLQTSNWAKGTGERYGQGEVYSFNNFKDALRWAAKMDWEFNTALGSGKISIVKFKKSDNWDVDENDPLSQMSNEGKWLKRMEMVKSVDILEVIPFTMDLVKQLTQK